MSPPEVRTQCDAYLSQLVTWSRYRGASYATVVLKASLALHHGRLATRQTPLAINWNDALRPSGALDRADETAPFSGGGAVLVSGFLYSQAASPREPALGRVLVGTDKPLVDKVIAAEQSGKIPLAWEQALRTSDNPVGTDYPVLVNPRNPTIAVGLGPVSPSWGPRVKLLPAPIGIRDNVLELPDRIDPRFFNPAPVDQQCQPLQGSECIVLINLVPNAPEFRTWLPALTISANISLDAIPLPPLTFLLDTLLIDAERLQAQVIWRAVTPIPPTTRLLTLEATLQGNFEEPAPETQAPATQAVAPQETPERTITETAAQPAARVLPSEPRQLRRLANPTRSIMQLAAERASLEDLDLSGVDLHGLDLSGLSLAHSKLDGANLSGTNLSGSNLWACSLIGAELAGARLDGADLEDANLSKALGTKVSFARASMARAKLAGARLEGAVLDDADLTDCDATGVALMSAKLRRLKANRANFTRALLVGADFQEAWLDFATFSKSSLDEANFAGASLADAELTHCAADGSSFANARLARARLSQSRFTSAALTGADFTSANLEKADFSRAQLDGAVLNHVAAGAAKFLHANLSGASLENADLRGADLSGARLTKVNRAGAKLDGAKLTGTLE